jgi:predicted Rossmann fold nucleotide-binding protein DprA/Smf involved in DNA uptake
MNVGIVGSRRWKSRSAVESLVKTLPADTTVVSGGARGVDSWAAEFARKRGLKVVEFLPDLPSNGSPRWEYTKAYHARNRQIAEHSEVVYAFVAPDRKGGTENTIKYAKELGVPVNIINEVTSQ